DEPDCCRVAVERIEAAGTNGVRLFLTFIVRGTHIWKGDGRPEYAATIYLQDANNRTFALQRVSGPSATDQPAARVLSGWYEFAPLPAGTQRVRLVYGGANINVELGQAAPR